MPNMYHQYYLIYFHKINIYIKKEKKKCLKILIFLNEESHIFKFECIAYKKYLKYENNVSQYTYS